MHNTKGVGKVVRDVVLVRPQGQLHKGMHKRRSVARFHLQAKQFARRGGMAPRFTAERNSLMRKLEGIEAQIEEEPETDSASSLTSEGQHLASDNVIREETKGSSPSS